MLRSQRRIAYRKSLPKCPAIPDRWRPEPDNPVAHQGVATVLAPTDCQDGARTETPVARTEDPSDPVLAPDSPPADPRPPWHTVASRPPSTDPASFTFNAGPALVKHAATWKVALEVDGDVLVA